MRISGIVGLVYGLLVVAAGWLGYARAGAWVTLAIGIIAGLVVLVSAFQVWKGKLAAAFVACGTAMLLGLFFGYQFIATGEFVPGGLMLLSSFGTLFVFLIDLFLFLQDRLR